MAIYYNGYQLSANPNITREMLDVAFQTLFTTFLEIILETENKHRELETFASQEPSVSLEPMSINLETVTESVESSINSVIEEVMAIMASIQDYGDGAWHNENNKLLLDSFMQNNNLSSPYRRSGDVKPKIVSDDVSSSESVEDVSESDVPNNQEVPDNENSDFKDPNTDSSESYTGDKGSDYWPGSGAYYVPFAGQSYTNSLDKTASIELVENSPLEEMTDALSSASASSGFFVPSIASKKISGVKSSGMVGAAGIVAAAAAAVAGKIYYDKKNENEDEDEDDEMVEAVEDTDALSEETGTEIIGDESMSSLNMVEFKEELLHIGEEDE